MNKSISWALASITLLSLAMLFDGAGRSVSMAEASSVFGATTPDCNDGSPKAAAATPYCNSDAGCSKSREELTGGTGGAYKQTECRNACDFNCSDNGAVHGIYGCDEDTPHCKIEG